MNKYILQIEFLRCWSVWVPEEGYEVETYVNLEDAKEAADDWDGSDWDYRPGERRYRAVVRDDEGTEVYSRDWCIGGDEDDE